MAENDVDLDLTPVEDGKLLKWDKEGVKVVGVLKSYKEQKTAMGLGNVYQVETKEGIIPFFAPSLLHEKLKNIAIGNIVSITYTKKTKTGAGTDLKHFDVAFGEPTEAKLKALGIEIFEKKDDNF